MGLNCLSSPNSHLGNLSWDQRKYFVKDLLGLLFFSLVLFFILLFLALITKSNATSRSAVIDKTT